MEAVLPINVTGASCVRGIPLLGHPREPPAREFPLAGLRRVV
ncbi:hypothetical protein COO91_01059 [Nostoc flagelliforme CCNUN1]|uniref:Uncharacterized protein n=1 Tax=Nostoc flagelliforme CCNUN1 TaxID=2038116 RepID=A0A2K8SIC1_9NOSO|nr:hypothetical protein COO91_01059 [Nostoc flagelliforme CCNUN1]